MRHRKKKTQLSRSTSHANLMIRNMVNDLILHEKLKTTHRKAQVVSAHFDKVVNIMFKDGIDGRVKKQRLHKVLNNPVAEKKVSTELADRYKDRKTGLSRVIRLGNRKGDNAPLSLIELV